MINVRMEIDIDPMWFSAKALMGQLQKIDTAKVTTIGKPQFKSYLRDKMLPIAEKAIEKSRRIIQDSMPGGEGNILRAAQINKISIDTTGITIGMFDTRILNRPLKRPNGVYKYYYELQEFGSVSTKPYKLTPAQKRFIAAWYAAGNIPDNKYRLPEAKRGYARAIKGKGFIKAAAEHLAKNISKLQSIPIDYLKMLSSSYARKKITISRLQTRWAFKYT